MNDDHMKESLINGVPLQVHSTNGKITHEIQTFGITIKLRIALDQKTCAANIANLINNSSTASSSAANATGNVTYTAPNAAGTTTLYCLVAQY